MRRRSGYRLGLRLALALVRLAGFLVPRHRRSTWIAEWRGELHHYWRRASADGSPRRRGVLRRSTAALSHAVALARQKWSPDEMLQDVRHAARRLSERPGFALAAIATMAIGIGANTAIFSVVHSTVIEPWPYEGADRLVFLWKGSPDRPGGIGPEAADIARWEETGVFEGIGIYGYRLFDTTLTGGEEPTPVSIGLASGGFFSFLGVNLPLGRELTDAEAAEGARVAIISHGFWKRQLAGDTAVLGRTVAIDGDPHTVVGVLPATLRFPSPRQNFPIWTPLDPTKPAAALARLRPGVTPQAATDALVAADAADPTDTDDLVAKLVRPQDSLPSGFARNIWLMQAAVGIVLLIACANVANLLLAHGIRRQHEMAVRAALGAGRGRLLRQLLTEYLVLALCGGVAGYGIARIGTLALVALRPESYGDLSAVRVDAEALVFTLLAAIVSGLVVGVAPALRATRSNVVARIQHPGGTVGREPVSLRGTLIVAEVAMSFVLLVTAALLLNSLARLTSTDLGFDPDNVLTMSISLPDDRYPEEVQRVEFFTALEQRIRGALGSRLRSMARASPAPPTMSSWSTTFLSEEHGEVPGFTSTQVRTTASSPGFLATLGIPLVDGRDFVPEDFAEGQAGRPVIVNARWARAMWGTQEAAGKGFSTAGRNEGEYRNYTVVGVIDDAMLAGPIPGDNGLVILVPNSQRNPWNTLVMRLEGDPRPQIGVVKEQVWALDPDLPVSNVATMEQRLAGTTAPMRFNTTLMTLFAGIALLLASIGLYGVLAYSVGQRTREIGIRVALGARKGHLVPLVVWQGMRLVLIGIGVGVISAIALARYIESLLYEVVAGTDVTTYLVVAGSLVAVSILACLIPARRAAALQAMEALRAG